MATVSYNRTTKSIMLDRYLTVSNSTKYQYLIYQSSNNSRIPFEDTNLKKMSSSSGLRPLISHSQLGQNCNTVLFFVISLWKTKALR